MVAGPGLDRVIGEFEESVESIVQKKSKGPDVKHHEQVKSVQATFAKQVKPLSRTIEEMVNPFEEQSNDLLVLDTRNIVGEEVVSTVHNIQKLGEEQYTCFVEEECLNKRTESLCFTCTLKHNKLALFSCPAPVVKSNEKLQIASLKKTYTLFSRLYVSCLACDGNIEEFFCHENQSYPPSLSHFGELRSGTNADLVE